MRGIVRMAAVVAGLLVVLAVAGVLYARSTGLNSRAVPGPLETRAARMVRSLAVPAGAKALANPVKPTGLALDAGLQHFARYCALCHGNDGSGEKIPLGKLFPRPPDLRAQPTQDLTDGELFYIIENGVRFTGMPAFGSDTPNPAGEELAWQLVLFIRRLPKISNDEIGQMQGLNPL